MLYLNDIISLWFAKELHKVKIDIMVSSSAFQTENGG